MSGHRLVFLCTLLLQVLAGSALAQRPFPPTVYDSVSHRSVFVFSDQIRSGINQNEARFAATHYVGAQKMPRTAIDLIRSFNENFLHLHYKLAITVDSIADYGMILDGNWFSDNRSPLSNWGQVREHTDWFLYTPKKEWVVHGERRIVMDITNPGFREWWVSSCIKEMEANRCDGVFADTYTVAAIGFRTNYPEFFDDVPKLTADWIPKLNDYGQYVYTRLDSAGYYFFPNIDNLQTTWANQAGTHYSKGEYIHGGMMESWGDWSSGSDATSAMTMAVAIQKKGVFLHGEAYFGGSNDMNPQLTLAQKRMWLAGTYLLANHGRLYLSMYGPGELGLGMSGQPLWYPEFELDLGPWVDEWDSMALILWQSVFRRRFEKGFVLANISSLPRTVDLGGTYYLAEDDGSTDEYWVDPETGREKVSLKYTPVSSLQMPAFSAAVLLYELPAGCYMDPKGDFNGDSRLNILDVIRLVIDIRAGSDNPCLDFNQDGEKNVSDAIALIVYLLKAI
ncbi:MAG TPA: putative glycoside hydrolase [archaeon]|nr:putative glycoside hydrolase [archaeon]